MDFLTILATIAAKNPAAAADVADRVESAVAHLEELAIGRPGRVAGSFELVLPPLPYIVAYALIPQPDGAEWVDVLQVIHAKRHWTAEGWPRD
jgi:toxin ParE1/3/4